MISLHALLTRPCAEVLRSPITLPADWLLLVGLEITAAFGAGLIVLGIRYAISAERRRREQRTTIKA